MDRKELTSGEAEPMEYGYRIPFYSTMELFVETLTGTCFELRVSPFETVISVKAKIQRLEGIPISQQYLIWHNTELEDDYCLHDYSITDGCTLKLVLAMRGGPINTRRIAMDEPTFREMADYVDANQEEFFENLSTPPSAGNAGGNKQVTLLVYRDGDQLNFFRVVDRGDGTLTPLSESLSGGSLSNMEEEEEGDVTNQRKLTLSQVVENNITASKMKQLRSHMHDLNIKGGSSNKKKQASEDCTSVPSVSAADNPLKMSLVRRHLSFSPKGSTSLAKESPGLPPSKVKTSAGNLLKDFASASDPKHSSAEVPASETLPKNEQKTNSENETNKNCENPSKIGAHMTPKPPKSSAERRTAMTPRSEGEMSEGEIILPSKNAGAQNQKAVHNANASLSQFSGTISKSELLRARLNRIKQAMNNNEAKGSGSKTPASENTSLDALWKKQLSKSLSTSSASESSKETCETMSDKSSATDDNSGKRSPRTQRLLAALSNNGRTQATAQSSKKKAPASTLPRFASSAAQGLAFNRHDMYLRSYGLLPSPDDNPMDDAVRVPPSTFHDTTVTKASRAEEADPIATLKAQASSKILETPHGVKYTTSGMGAPPHSRPWYDRTPRSPSAQSRNHPGTVRDNSKSDCPTPYSLFHPYQRDLKPIVRPPQGYQLATPNHPRLGSIQNQRAGASKPGPTRPASTWLAERTAGNSSAAPAMTSTIPKWSSGNLGQNQDKTENDASGGNPVTKDMSGSTALHPRPPSSSTTGVGGLRYHGRRQMNKPTEKMRSTQSTLNTTTSAVRMNDSPHGKIETMSRQEAREVVDFINRAVDASILRSLVKSPSKETFRGSSGQSSLRHAPAPFHHYESARHAAETGSKYSGLNTTRLGVKGEVNPLSASRMPAVSGQPRPGVQNSMLPPVKPSATKKKRCFLCSKKTGLATSYTCRCGNNFCATHRYAETHDCTYDYKTRGRKLLEENNPLVSAPKLPKI